MRYPLSVRFASQLLAGTPAADVATVVERICAVQAQDLQAARLAIRARSTGLTASDVDRALTEDRTHCVTWLNRGTLHLIHRDDYWWLHALTAPTSRTPNATRLAQVGVAPGDAERATKFIDKWLATDGPLLRRDIGERLAAKGIQTHGQALVHLLMYASLRGHIVRGPMMGREQAFVLARDWCGSPPRLDRDKALARLARRFLAGHAPAGDRDLAKWAGLPLRDVRRGLALIEPETVIDDDGQVVLASQPHEPAAPTAKLLGAFDPVLMGWVDRDWVLDGAGHILTSNGVFLAFALVDGVAAGTWRRHGSEVDLDPFRALSPSAQRALTAEAADVRRFLAAGPAARPALDVR